MVVFEYVLKEYFSEKSFVCESHFIFSKHPGKLRNLEFLISKFFYSDTIHRGSTSRKR